MRNLFKIALLVCLLWATTACSPLVYVQEWDDVYYRKGHRQLYPYADRWSYQNPYLGSSYYDWGYNPWTWNRPNVIIVQPQIKTYTPGKRPDRERTVTPTPPNNKDYAQRGRGRQ